jgi:hypothetical protein
MENHEMKPEDKKTGDLMCGPDGCHCKCGHHRVMPWLLVLFGLDFLLSSIGVLTWGFVSVTWPILVIIAGFAKMCRCCRK